MNRDGILLNLARKGRERRREMVLYDVTIPCVPAKATVTVRVDSRSAKRAIDDAMLGKGDVVDQSIHAVKEYAWEEAKAKKSPT